LLGATDAPQVDTGWEEVYTESMDTLGLVLLIVVAVVMVVVPLLFAVRLVEKMTGKKILPPRDD
jgi:hypothetical protein